MPTASIEVMDAQPWNEPEQQGPAAGYETAWPARRFYRRRQPDESAPASVEPAQPAAPNRVAHGGTVIFCSGSGGVGLSTLTAMTALTLQQRGRRCALVDLDAEGGGLDVLLGLEEEPGLRFSTLDAPLGRIDGQALDHELIRWEGVGVLSLDTWNGAVPGDWEVQAALTALGECNELVLVDAGRGAWLERLVDRIGVVLAVELSVLGLARGKAGASAIMNGASASTGSGGGRKVRRVPGLGGDGDIPLVIGLHPRGASRGGGGVTADDAEAYLGMPMVGGLRPDRALCRAMLGGLGIAAIPRGYHAVLASLARRIERMAFADARQGPGSESGGRHG